MALQTEPTQNRKIANLGVAKYLWLNDSVGVLVLLLKILVE